MEENKNTNIEQIRNENQNNLVTQNKDQSRQKNRKNKFIIITLLIILILIIGYLIYTKLLLKDDNTNNILVNNSNEETENKVAEIYIDDLSKGNILNYNKDNVNFKIDIKNIKSNKNNNNLITNTFDIYLNDKLFISYKEDNEYIFGISFEVAGDYLIYTEMQEGYYPLSTKIYNQEGKIIEGVNGKDLYLYIKYDSANNEFYLYDDETIHTESDSASDELCNYDIKLSDTYTEYYIVEIINDKINIKSHINETYEDILKKENEFDYSSCEKDFNKNCICKIYKQSMNEE